MNRRAFAVLPLALVFAACEVSFGALAGRASDEWTRSYRLGPNVQVEIANTNGKIDVEGVDGATLEVRAERIAKATSDSAAKELLSKIKINETVTPDRIAIETERLAGLMIAAGIEVRYHVKAPKTANLTVQTTNGGIALTGLAGKTTAKTTNGGVTGEGLGGELNARTTNGGIRIALASVGTDRVQMSTTNGGVRLSVPASARANLTASCTNGGIDVSGLKLEVQEQSRRRLEATLNGGGTPIELRTVNGGIRIRGGAAAAEADEK